METATWVIAAASALNVIVLGLYAWFTLGIWRETQRSGLRTEELARQARDTLKLQVLALFLEGTRQIASNLPSGDARPEVAKLAMRHYTDLLRRAFPEQLTEIDRINEAVLNEEGVS
jgi:hypothetical protein